MLGRRERADGGDPHSMSARICHTATEPDPGDQPPERRDGQRMLRRRVDADVGFGAAVFLLGQASTVMGCMLGDKS